MQQVTENVQTFSGMLAGRVYLITDPDGLTLIDASIAPSGARILAALEKAGHQPSDVKRILITHAHPDHVGGLHKVQQATDAQVMAGKTEAEVIEGKSVIAGPPRSELPALLRLLLPPPTKISPPTPVARVLSEGDVLPEVLGGLVALHTPGHAIDHLSFWQPERKILFCGDVMFNLRGLTLPFAPFTVNMEQNKQSAARLIALKPEVICFGHGKPLYGQDATQKLAEFAQRVKLPTV